MNKKIDNKGFSLVELIIVIAIMAILVGVLAPQFIKYVESSRQSTDIQNASEIRAAVEAYVAEKQPSDNITVQVNNANIKISGGSVVTELAKVGIAETTPCRSTGWKADATYATVATYSVTDFKWTTTATQNSKEPKKNLDDAFK